MKIEDSTFVAAVRQCYKCEKFSHIVNFCTKENNASRAEKQNTKDFVLKKLIVKAMTEQTASDAQ
jgi:hypothetical protein